MTQRLAGAALISGSLLFLIGAFSPIANRFFTEPDPRRRIEIVEADATGWAIMSVLFAAGAAITGGGLVLFALHLRRSQGPAMGFACVVAAGAALLGAGNAVIGLERAVRPPQDWVPEPVPWTAYAYIVLMQITLLIIGVALLRAGYPRWFGWTVLITTTLTVIVLVLVRNFPPLLFYMITLFMGISLAALPTADRATTPTSPRGGT
jgi:hypothetical protein